MVCALLFKRLFVALKRARARAKAFRVKKSEGRTVKKNIRSQGTNFSHFLSQHPKTHQARPQRHQLLLFFTFFGSIFGYSLFHTPKALFVLLVCVFGSLCCE